MKTTINDSTFCLYEVIFKLKNLKKKIIMFKVSIDNVFSYRKFIEENKQQILVLLEYELGGEVYCMFSPTKKIPNINFNNSPISLNDYINIDTLLNDKLMLYYADQQIVAGYLDGRSSPKIPYGGLDSWEDLTCNRTFIKV